MNDDDIIKALECCINDRCKDCPLRNIPKVKGCMKRIDLALDLINRQKAEIEQLKAKLSMEHEQCNFYMRMCAKAYSKAIEEFVEKLKEKSDYCYMGNIDALVYRITAKDLESIVKEILDGEHG